MDELTTQETFSYLTMASKAVKWALKSGIAIGLVGQFGLHVDNILNIVLASSALIGLLTAATNWLKHRYGWKWLP